MLERRHFLQAAMALMASGVLAPNVVRTSATQRLSQSNLLEFDDLGQVTLLHVTDIHAQLKPVWFREPSTNIGVGGAAGLPPHITGPDFLRHYGVDAGSAAAYALSSVDFAALAKNYGRLGGIDRLATLKCPDPEHAPGEHEDGNRGDRGPGDNLVPGRRGRAGG